jgi:hypothetical protein
MKRYLLFAGAGYYPAGGMYDYQADYDTLKEAKEAVILHFESYNDDWAHVWDTNDDPGATFVFYEKNLKKLKKELGDGK